MVRGLGSATKLFSESLDRLELLRLRRVDDLLLLRFGEAAGVVEQETDRRVLQVLVIKILRRVFLEQESVALAQVLLL